MKEPFDIRMVLTNGSDLRELSEEELNQKAGASGSPLT